MQNRMAAKCKMNFKYYVLSRAVCRNRQNLGICLMSSYISNLTGYVCIRVKRFGEKDGDEHIGIVLYGRCTDTTKTVHS